VHPNGVLAEIARRTGRGHSVSAKTVKAISDLLPYLCEAFEELEDSDDAAPRLLALADVVVFKGKADENGSIKSAPWLRAEADRGASNARA
jgi:hypothetical protein